MFYSILRKSLLLLRIPLLFCQVSIVGPASDGPIDLNKNFTIPVSSQDELGKLKLSNWLIVAAPVKQIYPDLDELQNVETINQFKEMLEAGATNAPTKQFKIERLQQCDGQLDFTSILGLQKKGERPQYTSYAVCLIESKSAKTAFFLHGNDGAADYFLNGVRCDRALASRNTNDLSFVMRLNLRAGLNFFVVRVNAKSGLGGLSFSDEMSKLEGIQTSAKNRDSMLSSLFLNNQDSVRLTFDTNFEMPMEIIVRSIHSAETVHRFFIDAKSGSDKALPSTVFAGLNGIYRIEFLVEGIPIFQEVIFVGDPLSYLEHLKLRYRRINTSIEDQPDGAALWRWIEFLTRSDRLRIKDRNWQLKYLCAVGDVEDIVYKYEILKSPHRTVPHGLHIKGIISKIDGRLFSYRIYVPKKASNDTVPLFIITPPVVAPNIPFEESNIIGSHMAGLEMAKMAEKQGAALLWLGYRTPPPVVSPLQLAHSEEVLEDVQRYLNIDKSRLHILGDCAGAFYASELVANWPGRFASIVFKNSVLRRPRSYIEDVRFGSIVDYPTWLEISDPFKKILSSGDDPPILLAHDGSSAFGHGEIEQTLDFLVAAKNLNRKVGFVKQSTSFVNERQWQEIFAWSMNHQRSSINDSLKPSFYRSPSGRGPISRAFAGPFLIVYPSSESGDQIKSCHAILTRMINDWKNKNFQEPVVIRDIDVTDDDLKTHNIILIGNADVNKVWGRLAPHDPSLEMNRVAIGNMTFNGENLGVQVATNNPRNRDLMLVLIGAKNLEQSYFDFVNLSQDGWFDFAVWSFHEKVPYLIDAGFYKVLDGPE